MLQKIQTDTIILMFGIGLVVCTHTPTHMRGEKLSDIEQNLLVRIRVP